MAFITPVSSLTNRGQLRGRNSLLFVLQTDAALAFGRIAVIDCEFGALVVIAAAPTSS
jgi:hypothetical protein